MTSALALFGSAIVVACCAPALLAPLTSRGASARLGLAAWLAAMASAGVSGMLGAYIVIARAAADWVPLTQTVCRSMAGDACSPTVYRSLLYEASVTALSVALAVAAVAILWRYCHRVQRAQRRTQAHAQAALLAGRALPGGAGTVVLDDPRPAAYCVAGRPPAIVVTSSALAVLDQPQLAAVLAHERAHLDGRHHLLATITRGLTAALPGVPLFTRGAAEVARLAEMAADDAATRSAGRPAMVTALLTLAIGSPVPAADLPGSGPGLGPIAASGLAAATCAVPDRVERLLNPPGPAAVAASRLALTAASGLLILLPAALTAICA
jgi:Zn-dependent protease with chaperone function